MKVRIIHDDEGTPVESVIAYIQNTLLGLSRYIGAIRRVNPDGIYGRETAESVRSFQRYYSLPVTGRVDYDTFTKLGESRDAKEENIRTPAGIMPFARSLSMDRALPSDYFDLVYIIQMMLNTVSVLYDLTDVGETGVYDERTIDAVRTFQLANNLPADGIVDRYTWNRLAEAYNKLVDSE
jgi:peptidoglycan hydrolase-like protein with peptidoglycan-binding domain